MKVTPLTVAERILLGRQDARRPALDIGRVLMLVAYMPGMVRTGPAAVVRASWPGHSLAGLFN
jgi:hypothetical protein